MPRFLFPFVALAGSWVLQTSFVSADPILDDTPAHSSVTRLGIFGTQLFNVPDNVQGGVTVEVDAVGNYYQASGSMVSKFNAGGVLQWSQSQSPTSFTVGSGELSQTTYYDRWTDDHGVDVIIQLASGYDAGESGQCYAQKIALDSSGDVFVSFLDVSHRDRSILAKFDGTTGVVEWVARTQYPHQSEATGGYVSKVVDLVVLPDDRVALLETGIATGHYPFTRLVIFASAGASQNGVPVLKSEKIHLADGGAVTRMSVGVGMVLAPDGSLVYATFEGDAPTPLPVYPDTYPAPDTLVLRKLAAPYTGTPVEVAHDTPEVAVWSDLEFGPGGAIYVLGTVRETNQRRHAILTRFDPTTLAETFPSRKEYPTPSNFFPTWDIPGIELLPTGTQVDDSLYIASGLPDFRHDPYLSGGFTAQVGLYSPGQLGVTKVDASGTILWQKHEYGERIFDAFTDDSDNVYLLGENFDSPGVGIFKYAPSGTLQVAHYVGSDGGRSVDGMFTGTINAAGNIAVAFPQFDTNLGGFDSPIVLYANPANVESGPEIDFPEFTASAHPGQILTLSATPSNGQPVFFHIPVGSDDGNTAYVAVDGTSLVLLKPGLIGVQAYQPNGSDFIFSEIRYLAIFKRQQTITFSTSTRVKFRKGKRVHLIASATSDLPVKFTSKGGAGNIVTKNGQQFLELKRAGEVTITASQSGNAFYERANSIEKDITIKK